MGNSKAPWTDQLMINQVSQEAALDVVQTAGQTYVPTPASTLVGTSGFLVDPGANVGDVPTLVNPLTGEVSFQPPAGGAVSSVFGRTGAVTAQAGDYSASDVGLGSVTNDAQLKRAAGDFAAFANKASPVGADVLLIEDSAAAGAKKNILISSLPAANSFTQDFPAQTIPGGPAWNSRVLQVAHNQNAWVKRCELYVILPSGEPKLLDAGYVEGAFQYNGQFSENQTGTPNDLNNFYFALGYVIETAAAASSTIRAIVYF